MIEVIAATARWVQLAANLILLGSCVFLAIAGTDKRIFSALWARKLERLLPWLALCIIAGLLVILATTISQTTGNISKLLQPDIWMGIVKDTRMGQIWIGREILAILLFCVVFYICKVHRTRWHYILCAVIAVLPLTAGSLASHAAAEEFSVVSIIPYTFHIILVGIWFGALPAFLLLILQNETNDKKTSVLNIETLKRFSLIALPVMILIITTGFIIVDRMFDGNYAALVATPYGWLLNTKLVLLGIILIIAFHVRSYWLPLFSNYAQSGDHQEGRQGLRKWVLIEFVLALILLLLATVIANTIPAKHSVIEDWPYSFRFSIEATWNQPNVALQVWTGLAVMVIAVVIYQFGRKQKWGVMRLISFPSLTLLSGMAIALPPLTIEAYPETYRRSSVPFDAASIASGSTHYAAHCVSCHGQQGMGNGIKSRTLSTKLPDMLTEQHTSEHTPGDFYHWITNGMKNTDMPGFADQLSVEERWDVINFLHALSRGYQARILTPEIVPNKPYHQPPNFSYAANDGSRGNLQEFRGNKNVLLVTFFWPQSQERIEQLKQSYDRLNEQNVTVLAVPAKELDLEDLTNMSTNLPFPIITQGATEISDSYVLLRRTLSHPDLLGRGNHPDHMEFLIDRAGYLRARWVPSAGESGWADIDQLIKQLSLLNRESVTVAVPEDTIR